MSAALAQQARLLRRFPTRLLPARLLTPCPRLARPISDRTFGSKDYWDRFYDPSRPGHNAGHNAPANSGTGNLDGGARAGTDWFVYDDAMLRAILRHVCADYLPASPAPASILHVGCGDSIAALELLTLSVQPRGAATKVHNIDSSTEALARLRAAAAASSLDAVRGEGTTFAREDVLCVSEACLLKAPFDVIFDKGCLDCFTADHTASTGRDSNAHTYLRHMHGLLREGGALLQVTEEPPEMRMPVLDALWPSGAMRTRFQDISDTDSPGAPSAFLYISSASPLPEKSLPDKMKTRISEDAN